ncbi:ubiquinol-cytochrome C reductase [Sulfurifustis variabilis]|uniref:Ubiquinol-cytochrome c reductase iron-sulfur subunit n=1 Tax=Sulfurifustis variabilis TaxID=1675686 RepID=A0A1C7AEZ9_9GAMM|nr:ubiquinol-cytochrome c reductase iron-sulfur subunit [Sulfurifustis variabilis]BAU49783.1 ubiquinol-cytochrome C reductase [Sulfurifustis variabilis]
MDTPNRRRRLLVVTSALGGVGLALGAVPFVASMRPSARARALGGPVEVDLGRPAPGALLKAEWRGKPIFVVRRTPEMLARLERSAPLLADPRSDVETQQPAYARNPYRSIDPEWLVLVGLCTHLGCVPAPHFEPGDVSGLGAQWPGGWFCHCHGSKFDLAGRVFRNVPAPTNLVVPPYRLDGAQRAVIGLDPAGARKT